MLRWYVCTCAGVNVVEVISSQMITYSTITCAQAVLLVISGVYIVDVSVTVSISITIWLLHDNFKVTPLV